MNSFLCSMACLFCGIFISKQTPVTSVWKYRKPEVSSKEYEQVHKANFESGTIPLIWKNISFQSLDSLDEATRIQDSINSKYAPNEMRPPWTPAYLLIDSFVITRTAQVNVKLGTCNFKMIVFSAEIDDSTSTRNANDFIEFYYFKGVGIVGAVHKKDQQISFEWEKAQLLDLRAKNGKSLIDKPKLDTLISLGMYEYSLGLK